MKKNSIITVQNIPITVLSRDTDDYICITDMAAAKAGNARAADVIKNWLRNRITLEYLGTWEQIYNSKPVFIHLRSVSATGSIKRMR